MDQVLRRLCLFQTLQPEHPLLRFREHGATNQAAAAMGIESLTRFFGENAVQGIRQMSLELAALNTVLEVLSHCLPAFYYVKVIVQVPFFPGLSGI